MESVQTEMRFFNTISESGDTLKKSQKQVNNQGVRILEIMRLNGNALTPFEVELLYNHKYSPVPITSIRRVLTDLAGNGLLVKLNEMGVGKYGKKNYKWKITSSYL